MIPKVLCCPPPPNKKIIICRCLELICYRARLIVLNVFCSLKKRERQKRQKREEIFYFFSPPFDLISFHSWAEIKTETAAPESPFDVRNGFKLDTSNPLSFHFKRIKAIRRNTPTCTFQWQGGTHENKRSVFGRESENLGICGGTENNKFNNKIQFYN